jgi:profilin
LLQIEIYYSFKTGGGIISSKTAQTIVVGTYGEGVQPGDAAIVVEKMADYLRNNNY